MPSVSGKQPSQNRQLLELLLNRVVRNGEKAPAEIYRNMTKVMTPEMGLNSVYNQVLIN